jgi:hypothetical protein
MTDYGHDLLFGTMLTPPPDRATDVVELAELTEREGLDLVSLPDHPYWTNRLDAIALPSVIVARTTTVRVLPNLGGAARRTRARPRHQHLHPLPGRVGGHHPTVRGRGCSGRTRDRRRGPHEATQRPADSPVIR